MFDGQCHTLLKTVNSISAANHLKSMWGDTVTYAGHAVQGSTSELLSMLGLNWLQESDALQGELKLLQAERTNLAREVSLKQELEAGWAQRAGQQAAALKEAQAKVTTLEKSLQQV
jgi:hypothetical protein